MCSLCVGSGTFLNQNRQAPLACISNVGFSSDSESEKIEVERTAHSLMTTAHMWYVRKSATAEARPLYLKAPPTSPSTVHLQTTTYRLAYRRAVGRVSGPEECDGKSLFCCLNQLKSIPSSASASSPMFTSEATLPCCLFEYVAGDNEAADVATFGGKRTPEMGVLPWCRAP